LLFKCSLYFYLKRITISDLILLLLSRSRWFLSIDEQHHKRETFHYVWLWWIPFSLFWNIFLITIFSNCRKRFFFGENRTTQLCETPELIIINDCPLLIENRDKDILELFLVKGDYILCRKGALNVWDWWV
jgi:hypothetical protein